MANSRRPASPAQARHRELAWMLYITEGFRANVISACTVNTYTLDERTLAIMHKIEREAERACEQLRREIGRKA